MAVNAASQTLHELSVIPGHVTHLAARVNSYFMPRPTACLNVMTHNL
jgi:hypothetical protein